MLFTQPAYETENKEVLQHVGINTYKLFIK
jgi:hypothetical protein